MALTVITGFSPAGKIEYGDRFIETFCRYWPLDVRAHCYVESQGFPSGRINLRHLHLCDKIHLFLERHKDNPASQGREPNSRWKESAREAGYNFRFDAYKFCRQCVVPKHAAMFMRDGEILCWLDADVVTFADVPSGFVESLLGDADLVHLGREPKHSEIGFWAVRLNPSTRKFLADFSDVFTSDEVFKLKEWHSAFVFDVCRYAFIAAGGKSRNLTPGGAGHVWFQSPLARYMDHLKGSRKGRGASAERK